MQDKLFYTLAGSFILGIFLRSHFDLGLSYILFFVLIAVVLFLSSFILKRSKGILILASVFLFVFSIGVFRFYLSDIKTIDPVLEAQVGQNILAEGVVSDEPDERENHLRLEVSLEELYVAGGKEKVETRGKALVSTQLFPSYSYGDRVLVKGKLEKPKSFITDVGKEFDYVAYLAKDRIYYQIPFAEVEFISSGHGNLVKRNLFALKSAFLNITSRLIPEPENSLLGGLLLGMKQSLGKELKQDFIDTGLIHIIVLSGYNVTIVAENIRRFFKYFLPKNFGFWLGMASIIFFAIMTGAGATVVRASIMAILVLIAKQSGRMYEITRALILAGILMIILNPRVLVFDISFQLSFLATIGLIYLAPHFERWFRVIPKFLDLRGILAATIGTQLFVLPFILWKMGTLSIVAPLTNALVLPAVPWAMGFGFFAGAVGFLSTILSLPLAWIGFGLLHYSLGVTRFFADLPFASVTISSFPLVVVIAIYILITLWLINKSKRASIE